MQKLKLVIGQRCLAKNWILPVLLTPRLWFSNMIEENIKYNYWLKNTQTHLWGPIVSGTQTTLEEARPNIWSHMYELCEKGSGPMSNLRVREYPRTINKRRDKVLLRGEVKNARGDLTVSEDYSHLWTSIRGVWWTYQSFRITPRTNPTAKWKGKISNRR